MLLKYHKMGLHTANKYSFKSHGCDEIAWFDIPLSIKEYLQNTHGQILKALEVRKWRDWERLDLSEDSAENLASRERTKTRIVKSDLSSLQEIKERLLLGRSSANPATHWKRAYLWMRSEAIKEIMTFVCS
jgi:hypothetical protein